MCCNSTFLTCKWSCGSLQTGSAPPRVTLLGAAARTDVSVSHMSWGASFLVLSVCQKSSDWRGRLKQSGASFLCCCSFNPFQMDCRGLADLCYWPLRPWVGPTALEKREIIPIMKLGGGGGDMVYTTKLNFSSIIHPVQAVWWTMWTK